MNMTRMTFLFAHQELRRMSCCVVVCGALSIGVAGAADEPAVKVGETAPATVADDAAAVPAASVEATGGKPPAAKEAKPAVSSSHYAPDRFAGRAGVYYGAIWGIDSITVRLVESGELVRFSYRVVDPAKARLLNDKQAEARLDDPKAGVSLVVPTMEKIGQLRQTTVAQAGKSYWMTFSNKGRRVARGDRVDVVIGSFRASNLVVD